jgi:parallel beta-helix repeat protein
MQLQWMFTFVLTALLATTLYLPMVSSPGATPATTAFYVSNRGNDANAGRTVEQPWRTLARVQHELADGKLRPGDQLLFARGSTFTGTLTLNNQAKGTAAAPITLAAYGSGAPPLLSGLQRLVGWQALGNQRWQLNCTTCSGIPALLLINGEAQRLARWPNLDEGDEGYRYYNAFAGRTSITDDSLPVDQNWVGGEVVLRSIAWILDRLPIAKQAGGTLSFSTPASYDIGPGWGYFIQNHLAALDREGEWLYDAASKTITLQWSSDPNTARIEIPSATTLLEIRGSAYVVLRDLALYGASQDVVNAADCANITLDQIVIRYSGDEALRVDNCSAFTLRNALVQDSMNVGVRMQPCPNCLVTGTTIERIGLLAGMGGNGDGQYFATDLGGSGFVIEKSIVREVGYLGIALYGSALARNNLVSGFNRVKNDGAGIYTYRNTDVAILNNIVRDAAGSKAGNAWGSSATHGIYIDDNSERVTVQGNTVANVGNAGIFLHNTRNVTVTENLIFAVGEAGILLVDDALGTYALEQSLLRQNQIVVRSLPMITVQSDLNAKLFDTLGMIDGNRFCDPFGDPLLQVNLPQVGASTLGLAQWQADYGRDLSSTVCADRYPARTVIGAAGVNLVNNGTFTSNLNGWFGWPDDTLDARWESGRLDGGSLWLGYKGTATAFHYDTGIGGVQTGQSYRLRFSALGLAGRPALKAYLRQSGAPYVTVS